MPTCACSAGTVRAGDEIAVDYRPDHDVTVELAFRARTSEPDLLPRLLVAEALRRHSSPTLDVR